MGDCPSDKWFFGSVFVFLIAAGLLAGGAVNMQSAADDPRTPRVKTYGGSGQGPQEQLLLLHPSSLEGRLKKTTLVKIQPKEKPIRILG